MTLSSAIGVADDSVTAVSRRRRSNQIGSIDVEEVWRFSFDLTKESRHLRVFPPGQFHSQNVPLSTQECIGKSVLSVDSVHPGTGIPGFTNS
jgi:hypothetical protein